MGWEGVEHSRQIEFHVGVYSHTLNQGNAWLYKDLREDFRWRKEIEGESVRQWGGEGGGCQSLTLKSWNESGG